MTKESFTINGENLLKKVKEMIAEGNIRRITISNKDGKQLASFPLVFGILGILVMPVLLVVGAIAAVVGEYTVTVEREEMEYQQTAQQ